MAQRIAALISSLIARGFGLRALANLRAGAPHSAARVGGSTAFVGAGKAAIGFAEKSPRQRFDQGDEVGGIHGRLPTSPHDDGAGAPPAASHDAAVLISFLMATKHSIASRHALGYTSARSRAPAASRSRFHFSAAAVEMSTLVPTFISAGAHPARRIFQNISTLMRKAAQNSLTV